MGYYLPTGTKPTIEDSVTRYGIVYRIFVYRVTGGYVFTMLGGPSGHEFYGRPDGTPFSSAEQALMAAQDETVDVDEVLVSDDKSVEEED